MSLEAVLCLAFDRRATSGPFSASVNNHALDFQGLMLSHYNMVLEWQETSNCMPDSLLSVAVIDKFVNKVDFARESAQRLFTGPSAGKCIQDRVRMHFFNLHISAFEATVLRFGTMVSSGTPAYRLQSLNRCRTSLQETIRCFLALDGLTPIASVSWPILSSVAQSAMLLSKLGYDETGESKRVIQGLVQSFYLQTNKSQEGIASSLAPFADLLNEVLLQELI